MLILATAFGHMQFARAGWFYRYEAYLVTFGAYVASRWLLESTGTISRWITTSPSPAATALAATALALFALVPVVQRALWATLSAPRAAANIHQQQRQVARFLKAHYEGAAVALIDVGLANFEVDLRCLDMAGLADLEVWREVKAGRWSADALAAMAARRGVVLAVMHQGGWLPYPGRGPPAAWRAMGSWRIPLNVVCAHDTVTFHAPGPDSRQRLADSLEAFTPHLAPGVVPGEYLR
ncbi:MAG: hypothetical protein HY815_14510 [Candidatus Riflebacteria bacterium]|nr:hypothetical protein [Candidatus Riflebacteria bacterium]